MSSAQIALSTLLRWLSSAIVVLLIVFLFVPVVIVVILSFSNATVLQFPPEQFGVRQYVAFAQSDYWRSSVVKSLEIAFPTALVAVLVGMPAVFAFNRTRLPFREGLELSGLAPFLLPGVAYAIALFAMYAQFHIVGTTVGLILADSVIALPYVVVIVGAAIKRVSPDLELVAMSLGASRGRAMFGITFRLVLPAILAAFVLAFLAAFDEATFVNFVGGPDLVTLPKAIFDSLRLGVDPLITGIATILMAVTGLAMTGAVFLRRT
ncbi:MAG TPA: ABC transporter permease [Candidatus Dormibacteraeota bacterium]